MTALEPDQIGRCLLCGKRPAMFRPKHGAAEETLCRGCVADMSFEVIDTEFREPPGVAK